MLKWIETTGRSEEDAIAAALFQLGMDRDDVSVEVIERAKSGFLGFGGNPAKVRVSYEVPDEEQTAPAAAEETVQEAAASAAEEQEPAPAPQREDANRLLPGDEVLIAAEEPAPVQGDDGKAEQIRTFLTGLMEHLHVQAVPEITLTPEGSYKVVLQGQGLGAIIGRRGETLDAIQQLTSYSVNHGQSKRVRIHVDAENYRVKREDSLRRYARKKAQQVLKQRRRTILEPMNAYERHVVHAALQDVDNITTYSTGTEPNRRVIIEYVR